MLVIGIAGGIACGKSSVAANFQRLGAELLDADRVGHEVLLQPEVLEEIRVRWGESVISNGRVVRKALAAIVFAEGADDELMRLEAIMHPRIGRVLKDKILKLKSKQEVPAVVLDAPVMFKAGWDQFCDKIVFVDLRVGLRQERALATRGWSPDELISRERKQIPLTVKRERASDIIDNSGTPEQLTEQVHQLWDRWGLSLSRHNKHLPKSPKPISF